MDRNYSSHFSQNPVANIPRSKFPRHNDYKTTASSGKLFCFHLDEVLPGDTFEVSTGSLFRMSTPLYPVLDNCYLDYFYFFCPARLLWEHWEQFMGAHESAWDSDIVYQIPKLTVPEGGFEAHSLADYMGVPTYTGAGEKINVLPFRAYRKIWNDWFRDQNTMDEVKLNLGDDGDVNGDEDYSLVDLLPVCKLHDYFTSCLPQPQRGSDVLLPSAPLAPVFAMNNDHGATAYGINWTSTGDIYEEVDRDAYASSPALPLYTVGDGYPSGTGYKVNFRGTYAEPLTEDFPSGENLSPNNLYADMSETVATVTDLRNAFAIQRMLEKDSRSGSKYTEVIRAHFGIISPDGRLQRSEYLGGKRIPINITDVSSMAANGIVELGQQGAFSKTVDSDGSFVHSFTEHGYLLGVACIRTDRSYQNGLHRLWSRSDRLDFYWSEFNGVGDEPVYESQIYWQDADAIGITNKSVFGYQERYADYRMGVSLVTGAFRSNYPGGSLDVWHYADNYNRPPVLSEEWMKEPPENIARTLAVTHSTDVDSGYGDQQFICNFFIKKLCTRPMPIFSYPGMNGHF